MIDSTKTWKYLSIGLMAILAAGISLPQAFAHITTDTQHMLEHIYKFINTEIRDIKEKTDNLPPDPASQTDTGKTKAIVTEITLDPQDNEVQNIEIIPLPSTAMTFSGHISGATLMDGGNSVLIICGLVSDDVTFPSMVLDAPVPNSDSVNVDFSCTRVFVQVTDEDDGNNVGPVTLNLVTQYVETSNVSTQT